MARDTIGRYQALLATPVLRENEVPLISFAVGQPVGWRWDGVARGTYGTCRDDGTIYVGRERDDTIKVGFTRYGLTRCNRQKLRPLLFVVGVEARQEKLLHELFADEATMWSERFQGPRVELFVRLAADRAQSCARDWGLGAHMVERVERHALSRLARKVEAA